MGNKIARIRVPREKLALAIDKKMPMPTEVADPGWYRITMLGVDSGFLENNDTVYVLEGDPEAIEPMIHALMEIVHSKEK